MVNKKINEAMAEESVASPHALSVDASSIPNAVLRRLIEEVRHDHQNHVAEYNRTHNRHNRGR